MSTAIREALAGSRWSRGQDFMGKRRTTARELYEEMRAYCARAIAEAPLASVHPVETGNYFSSGLFSQRSESNILAFRDSLDRGTLLLHQKGFRSCRISAFRPHNSIRSRGYLRHCNRHSLFTTESLGVCERTDSNPRPLPCQGTAKRHVKRLQEQFHLGQHQL
jgi:hypothetical protein